ncbi:MAG TPA: phage terminase small subunit P27 family, partial [Paracoccus sp.]|nr:phage terminase small subunit P27 family [Paracoccus sp. (in: a-proteobacteria)]
ESEPRFAPEIPTVPGFLSEEAQAEWARVCVQLYNQGVLSQVDRAALAAYCQAYGRWQQAEEALSLMGERDRVTKGMMIKTTNGNAVQNPLVGTANKAMADMMRYATEFGMTPSARSRITASMPDEDDPFGFLSQA